ncbi:hypothetical protein KP509_26G019500 [Ceratopteris richardii]|nr:hypothetical protein KP509_26G019500 [Ceratopteris richardii]
MSKSLESELQEPLIDLLQESYPTCAVEDLDLGHSKQPLLLLSDTPFHLSSPPASPPPSPCEGPHNSNDATDKLVTITDKQSKQAVYDMFCHYEDTSKQATLQTSKRPLAIIDAVCAGQLRKQKHRPGRMSLQGLAKALHSITHPQSQHHAISKDNGEDDSIEDYHHHHHHHHLHRNPTSQSTKGNAYQSARRRLSGDCIPNDSIVDGAPLNARHVHHHHHHHYHYLFHSDDDFRLQPLDKSLMVAAAGLRSSKVNAPLHSEDDFRALQPMDKSLVVAEAGLRSSKSNSTIPRFLESPARSVDISVEYGRK